MRMCRIPCSEQLPRSTFAVRRGLQKLLDPHNPRVTFPMELLVDRPQGVPVRTVFVSLLLQEQKELRTSFIRIGKTRAVPELGAAQRQWLWP